MVHQSRELLHHGQCATDSRHPSETCYLPDSRMPSQWPSVCEMEDKRASSPRPDLKSGYTRTMQNLKTTLWLLSLLTSAMYPQRTMEPVPKSYGVTSTHRVGSDAGPAIKAASPATSMLQNLATPPRHPDSCRAWP